MYLKDTIYFLSNIIVEHHDYESPDNLYYFLSSFSQKKVEAYFKTSFHKDITDLSGDSKSKLYPLHIQLCDADKHF